MKASLARVGQAAGRGLEYLTHLIDAPSGTSYLGTLPKAPSSLVSVTRFSYIHVDVDSNYRRCLLGNRRLYDGFVLYLAARYAIL